MTILVTGVAGFIGFHVALALLAAGHAVVGVDDINDYYDVSLKEARLALLAGRGGFSFERIDIAEAAALDRVFASAQPRRVIHLAAQAGVRYGAVNPRAYAHSNLIGFLNVLECCRHRPVEHLVFASSSSVYGANTDLPYAVTQNVDRPLSLYAATKKSNELMAHAYAHLYGMATTGLRFFTVYGAFGRPDMSYFLFTKRIVEGEVIEIFNNGDHSRDFTYIDDIVDGVLRVMDAPPEAAGGAPPYRIYNLGNNKPVELMHVIATLERLVGESARIKFTPMQMGDVEHTCADIAPLMRDTGFAPHTTIEDGLARFVDWYRAFYRAR